MQTTPYYSYKVVISLAILVATFALYTSSAKAIGELPFGGVVIAVVPPTPVCVGHSLIINFASTSSPLLGISYVPFRSQLYQNYDFATVGSFVLGDYDPFTPFLCPVPYQVVPIGKVGTS